MAKLTGWRKMRANENWHPYLKPFPIAIRRDFRGCRLRRLELLLLGLSSGLGRQGATDVNILEEAAFCVS